MTTYNLTNSIPSISNLETGDILNCSYSGTYKQITLPKGQYKFECWGASCSYNYGEANTYNGRGGYSTGVITLAEKTKIFLYVGQEGPTNAIAFNGGGYATSNYSGRAGGGASDIRIGTDSLYARVIVAGGGGGGSSGYGHGGYGGGETGGQGYVSSYPSTGGTQTAGGKNSSQTSAAGSFGQGGADGVNNMGSGGGGWYGGAGGYFSAGGGGSGYVYTSSTASNYPSGCLLNSNYYLTNAQTIAGSTSFTSPSGFSETGHAGNGYIRITALEVKKSVYVKIPLEVSLPSSYTQLEYIKGTGTQYIDTEFKPNNNSGYEIKFQMNATTNTVAIMGAETTWKSVAYAMWAKHLAYGNNAITDQSWDSSNTNSPVIFTFDKTQFKKNNEVMYQFNSASFSCLYNAYIFGTNRGGNFNEPSNSLSVYYCKIYDNGTLIRDFVPAKRNSDNVLGLYDIVNNKFYTNAGTGTFIAGSEKTPWRYGKELYVKVNGEWVKGEI